MIKGSYAGAVELPVGAIISHAGPHTSIPAGYLLCDGSDVFRATYRALFAVIGVSYGAGDGVTTFGLPDYVDAYSTPSTSNTTLARNGSSNTHSHASVAAGLTMTMGDGQASHSHADSVYLTNTGGVGSHAHNANLGWNTGNSGSNASKAAGTGVNLSGSGHDHNVSSSTNSATQSHSHNANTGNSNTSTAGAHASAHWSGSNGLSTDGSVAPSGQGSSEPSFFKTLYLIRAG